MTSQPTPDRIYKIFRPVGWDRLMADGQTVGSALDQTDGYIHFSTAGQLKETLDLHFETDAAVEVAEVAIAKLPADSLRWEASRGGALFPHLYARLPREAVTRHWTLRPGPDGRYALPDFD